MVAILVVIVKHFSLTYICEKLFLLFSFILFYFFLLGHILLHAVSKRLAASIVMLEIETGKVTTLSKIVAGLSTG